MNELIKVTYDNERPTASARELWEYLDKPYDKFTKWFDKYKEYGFSENEDYQALCIKVHTAQGNNVDAQDYQITVEMAKELCMLQKTDKGSQARKYFIELEKQWNNPEMVMARALKLADTTIKHLQSQIEDQKPLVEFANTVTKSCDNILMRDMAKLLCDQHINIGEKRLYKQLREHEVLMQDNTPYQSYVDRKYFVVKESSYKTPYGEKLNKTTLVTPKGQIWIVGKVKEWLGMTDAN